MGTTSEIKLYMDRARLTLQQSKDNSDLGHYDVAVSRAYYAMFYAATALLHSQGISRRKHSGVHSAFGQHFVKTGLIEPEYSRMLGNAFRLRLNSDYDVMTTTDERSTDDTLRDARQFVERVDAYLRQEGYL